MNYFDEIMEVIEQKRSNEIKKKKKRKKSKKSKKRKKDNKESKSNSIKPLLNKTKTILFPKTDLIPKKKRTKKVHLTSAPYSQKKSFTISKRKINYDKPEKKTEPIEYSTPLYRKEIKKYPVNQGKKLRRMKKYYKKWEKLKNRPDDFIEFFNNIMFQKRTRQYERKRKKYEDKFNKTKNKETKKDSKDYTYTEDSYDFTKIKKKILQKRPKPEFRKSPSPIKYSPLNNPKKRSQRNKKQLNYKERLERKFRRTIEGGGTDSDSDEGFGLEDLEQENLRSRHIGKIEDKKALLDNKKFSKRHRNK